MRRQIILGLFILALAFNAGPAWAGKGKLEARLDSSGKVYFIPKAGKAGKSLYWGPNPKEARRLKDGERVYIAPKRKR